eukprot:CAMPEP_0197441812 /NCGR_PEP_ID=MMETSP1175-20131217/7975_1 /TAXON_ID=1003142 /ORGANISM="Triceratium dubium, Strain CCMP147" /LENGTH=449 /DNA_ID=CAMNT_0042972147 /DNA_START=280 /DNA_END=1626 /DNA_ORIENTATION=+
MTADDICQIEQNARNDDTLCGSQRNCADCTSTTKSDGRNCRWLGSGDDEGFCQSSCGMAGCGSDTCPSSFASSCDNFNSCLGCLDQSCAWAVGSCLPSCDIIADVSCYSAQNFPNMSATEICEAEKNDVADASLCMGKRTCDECTATVKSDGEGCQWLEDFGCMSGCSMMGCGVNTCQSSSSPSPSCDGFDSCLGCLGQSDGGTCAWAAGSCINACNMVADVACYSSSNYPNNTADEICRIEQKAKDDETLCGSQRNCADCTSTTKSDGGECLWLGDGDSGGFCQSFCGLAGCGSPTCPSSPPPSCNNFDSCLGCLDQSGGRSCAWAAGSCLPSCDFIADASCYSTKSFPGMLATDICQAENNDMDDASLCISKETCDECTATIKSDGEGCQWFEDEDTDTSGCMSSCGMMGCGVSTCSLLDTASSGNVLLAKTNIWIAAVLFVVILSW